MLFDIPDSWEWARLKSFCLDIFSGKSPKYEKAETEFRIIGQAANQQSGLDYSQVKYTNKDFWCSMDERYFLRENDVILNTLGNGTLGRSGIIEALDYPILTDGHLFVFRTVFPVSSWYLYLFLQQRKEEIEKTASGSTNQTFLSLSSTMEWVIPVPPLSEQERIVAKYRSVLSSLESYDAAYVRVEELNASFPEMLKKSILQMAVQGKLVPQDPSDEPASVLLERIHAEKERLIKEGKIKRNKNEAVIFRRDNSHYEKLGSKEWCIDNEIPFDIPGSWEWTRLSALCKSIADGDHQPPPQVPSGIPFLVISDVSTGQIDFSKTRFVPLSYYQELSDNRVPEKGDLLFTVTGSYGIVVPVRAEHKFCFQRHMALLKPCIIDPLFFAVWLTAPLVYEQCRANATGTAQKTVGLSTLRNLLIPVPPMREQRRIAERLHYLLPIINSIE